jgi:hypothetical protein
MVSTGSPSPRQHRLGFDPGIAAASISFFAFLYAGAFGGGFLLLALAIVSGVIAFGDSLARGTVPFGKLAWLVIFAIFAAYPMVMINNDFSEGYFHGGMVLASFGIASAFFRVNLHRIVMIITLILILYYTVIMVVTGNPGDAFSGSENRVSSLFLALAVFMFAQGERRYDLAVAAVVFLVIVSAEGSGGIIAATVLLAAVFFRDTLRLFRIRVAARLTIVAVGLVAIAGVASVAPKLFDEQVRAELDPERLIQSDIRFEIIDWYVQENLHGMNLFIGAPLSYSIPILTDANGWVWMHNLHTSYLDLHSKTGILAIIALGAFGVRMLHLLRRNPYLAALFLVLLVRAFSDTAFILQGQGNFALYAFLLPLNQLLPRHETSTGLRDTLPRMHGDHLPEATIGSVADSERSASSAQADSRRGNHRNAAHPGPLLDPNRNWTKTDATL